MRTNRFAWINQSHFKANPPVFQKELRHRCLGCLRRWGFVDEMPVPEAASPGENRVGGVKAPLLDGLAIVKAEQALDATIRIIEQAPIRLPRRVFFGMQ